jgi:hypothetical protein
MTQDTKFLARCWQCGKENSDAAPISEDESVKPKDNDLLLCFYCGAFMVVDLSMPDRVHKPTPAENFEIKHSNVLQEIHAAWVRYKIRN